MRIAVFSRSTPSHHPAGGMERHLDQLVRGLAELGHEVTVFTTSLRKNGEPDLEGPRLRFVYIAATRPGRYGWGFWDKAFRAFEVEHQSSRFDAVVSQSAGAWGLVRRRRNSDPPVLAIIHGTPRGEVDTALRSQPFHPKTYAKVLLGLHRHYFHDRVLLPKCDRVIAVSQAVAERVRREMPGMSDRVEVVLNGVDAEAIQPQPSNGQRILFAGRVIPEKGAFVLLQSFGRIASQFEHARLVFVGSGQLDRLRRERDALGLRERVEIVGSVPHREIAGELAKGSIFVLPSLRDEGLPLSLLEAMAAGLPIVTSERGGIGEAVRDGVEGILLPSVTEETVAAALETLLQSSDLRSQMGERGRRAVEERFDIRSMVAAYASAIEEMVRR